MLKKMRPYIMTSVICPILVFIEAFCDIQMPFLMAEMVDKGIGKGNVDFVFQTGIAMILYALLALVAGAFSNVFASISAQGIGSTIRESLFTRIQMFSFRNIDKFRVPSLITRLTSDVNNIQMGIMVSLRMLFRAPFMMVLALYMVLQTNRQLAIIYFFAIPILAVILFFILRSAHPRFIKMQNMLDNLNTSIQESITNIRVTKSFVQAPLEKEKFAKSNNAFKNAVIRAVKLVMMAGPAMQLVMYACIVMVFYLGGNMVLQGDILIGELMSFITYSTQILMALMMLSMLFLMFTRGKASADRIAEVFKTEIDIKENEGGVQELSDGSVEFKNVNFSYPDNLENNLENINLKIHTGEFIGIIGPTGSGKTSLMQLILRLYDATSGEVLVGGVNVRDYELKKLREKVGIVLQKNTLFSGTIKENLLWGNENASFEEIKKALEISQAWDFVSKMPEGIESRLEQGGSNLSGGQKQRLCLARTLLKNPKILILDDSTSAVDMATDAKIRHAMKTRTKDMTTIIIAQRMASIEHADRVIVLEEGKVTGFGTHEELLGKNSLYKEVYFAGKGGLNQ